MSIVIIGAGPAGVTVAETLRKEGYQDEIIMFSGEDYPPYAPAVMASYFEEGGDTIFWKGRDFYERLGIVGKRGVWIGEVIPSQKKVVTRDGEEISFDKLVIASGSTLYAPIACNCDQPLGEGERRFYNFKSLTAAKEIQDRVHAGEVETAVIVGAGFIGTEIALVLADAGVKVTQIEMLDRVMPRMLDKETSLYAEQELRAWNIDLRLNTKGVEFRGRKMAESLLLENGEEIKADIFIAATGVRPNIEFLQDSGLPMMHGLLVDDYLEAGAPDVYAAGDVAETIDLVNGERYVHALHPNAVTQGTIVGYNILGYRQAYPGAENINSLKHFGMPIVAAGDIVGEEELKTIEDNSLRKIILRNNRIVGFRLVGDIKNAGVYHSLMYRKVDVSPYKRLLLSSKFNIGFLEEFAQNPSLVKYI